MRPDREELTEAIRDAADAGRFAVENCYTRTGVVIPGQIADAVLAHWSGPGPMSVDEAIAYAEQLTAELGRALAFVRDGLMSDPPAAGAPAREHQSILCWCQAGQHTHHQAAKLNGVHLTGGACWCRLTHTVAGAEALTRSHRAAHP